MGLIITSFSFIIAYLIGCLFCGSKMTEKPDFVTSYQRPKNTEIKKIGNYWYLYERFSKYDPATKRSRKISGKCLGKLTAEGLIPTTRRLVKESSQGVANVSDVVEAGAVLFFWSRTAEMRDRLKEFFPDLWQTIYAAAILRTIKEPRLRRLQTHYETSLLAHLLPKLSLDAPSNSALLRILGRRRDAICRFMQVDVQKNDVFILFDGHRLITSSKTMELAELGYDSKRRFKPQVNLLYVYSLDYETGSPVYYKQFLGSTPDVSAFSDILNECAISNKNYTVIADKGFASDEDFRELEQRALSYVIPIKRGSKLVAAHLPLTPQSYSELFTYHGRAIQALKIEEDGFNVFVYYDAQLYANELADAAERAERKNEAKDDRMQREIKRRCKGNGKLSDEQLLALQPQDLKQVLEAAPEMGTVSIRTNRLDLNSHQVYRTYKQRQAIEQFFRTYGASMDFDASYMRDRTSQEAWLFLNHLSATMAMECMADIARLGEDKNISFEDLRQTLGKVMANKINGQWTLAPIKKSVQKLIAKLDFQIDAFDLDAMTQEGGTLPK